MSLRVQYIEAARKGDLAYLHTAQTPTQAQLNRAFRIACKERRHDIVTFLIGQGANDFEAAILVACSVNDVFLLETLCNHVPAALTAPHFIYLAFLAACSNHSTDAAYVMATTGKIEWTYRNLAGLSNIGLETALRAFKRYWDLNVGVITDEWFAAKYLQLLQPWEYYHRLNLLFHEAFPVMADSVISHRLDKYYRFKGYLIFYLPIPDLVTLCCGYF